MDIKKLLGKKIKEIRKANNLTQEKMSEMIGIEPASLSNIENGKYYPTAENLEKILKTLNVTASELYNFEYYSSTDVLLKEMNEKMLHDEKLLRLMYKFFSSIKYS